ncbi:hypothetical protein BH10PSE2_BH10PSE2_15010 [soil metagenome]
MTLTSDTRMRPPRSKALKLWLIIDSILSALAIIPVAMMGMMSVMASDAGVNTMIYTFIWVGLSFPVAVALSPILAWIAFGFRKPRLALILSLAPALWVIAFVVIFSMGFGNPHAI